MTSLALPPAAALESALAELLQIAQHQYAISSGDPEERKFWRAQRQAYINAQGDYYAGRLPLVAGETYLIPSASRAGAYHLAERQGGVWICSCEAGERGIFHRHTALISAIEYAAAAEQAAEPASEPAPEPVKYDHIPPRWQAEHERELARIEGQRRALEALNSRFARAPAPAPEPAPEAERLQLSDAALIDRLIARVAQARAKAQAQLGRQKLEAA